jgi:hypothetical protein
MLAEVANTERWMMDDFPFFQLFFTQQELQQGRFSCAIASDESDFDIVNQRQLSVIQQQLVSKSFLSITNLYQYGHSINQLGILKRES